MVIQEQFTFISRAEGCWRFAIKSRKMAPDSAFVALFDQRHYRTLLMGPQLLFVVIEPRLAKQFLERLLSLMASFYILRANYLQTASRDVWVLVTMAVVP